MFRFSIYVLLCFLFFLSNHLHAAAAGFSYPIRHTSSLFCWQPQQVHTPYQTIFCQPPPYLILRSSYFDLFLFFFHLPVQTETTAPMEYSCRGAAPSRSICDHCMGSDHHSQSSIRRHCLLGYEKSLHINSTEKRSCRLLKIPERVARMMTAPLVENHSSTTTFFNSAWSLLLTCWSWCCPFRARPCKIPRFFGTYLHD